MLSVPFTLRGQPVRADTPVSTWSPQWLGYTRWDGIIVTREDLADLARGGNETVAVLQALWQYVETGGTLLVVGPGKVDVPAGWRRFRSTLKGFTVYAPGFGRCLVSPDRNSANWDDEAWGAISSGLTTTSMPWNTNPSLSSLNESLPVIDSMGVRAGWLFAIMILFTLLIGPVNLVLLTKYNRRIWMLWTVPAVSFFTCVMVFAYMIVAEGWQGHAAMASLTILDEVEKRATTLGRSAFYSPLTPSDGLRYSSDTEVSPLGHDHSAFTSNCWVDWDDGQHLARGWVSARVPAHFMLRKSEPRRESIKAFREGGSLVVVNRLGVDIRTLTLADEKGQLYEGSDIAAGEKATLKPIKGELKAAPNAWRGLYTSNLPTSMRSLAQHPEDVLLPRTYLAELRQSPFLEQGLRGATRRPSVDPASKDRGPPPPLVLGIMADLQ
jgi:hypothetical protein